MTLRLAQFAAILLWLTANAQFVFAVQELRRILYGTTASPAHLPVWVAKDAGFFEKNGLHVEPVQIRGGSLILAALIEGVSLFAVVVTLLILIL